MWSLLSNIRMSCTMLGRKEAKLLDLSNVGRTQRILEHSFGDHLICLHIVVSFMNRYSFGSSNKDKCRSVMGKVNIRSDKSKFKFSIPKLSSGWELLSLAYISQIRFHCFFPIIFDLYYMFFTNSAFILSLPTIY